MKYWLSVKDSDDNTDIRGPFDELEGALRETKLFKPYSEYEFIVFPLRTTFRKLARAEADKIWTTPILLEDHIVGGWIGYIGKLRGTEPERKQSPRLITSNRIITERHKAEDIIKMNRGWHKVGQQVYKGVTFWEIVK